MARIRFIQVRVDRRDYQQILDLSRQEGFRTLSGYLRHRLLSSPRTEERVREIHQLIVGQSEAQK